VVKCGRGERGTATAAVVAESQWNSAFDQQWKEMKGIKNESQCQD